MRGLAVDIFYTARTDILTRKLICGPNFILIFLNIIRKTICLFVTGNIFDKSDTNLFKSIFFCHRVNDTLKREMYFSFGEANFFLLFLYETSKTQRKFLSHMAKK